MNDHEVLRKLGRLAKARPCVARAVNNRSSLRVDTGREMMPLMPLSYPFHVPPLPPVTQPFANVATFEPWGYRYADGTVGYVAAPGAVHDRFHNGIDYAL